MRTLAILLAALMLMTACASDTPATPTPAADAPETSTNTQAEPPRATAPDFTLTALDGTTYTLSELRGQWVLINWWATWCGPCVTEMPYLQSIADERGGELLVLGLNLSETREQVEAFAQERSITFPLLLEPSDATIADYSVSGLPQTLVIDPNGEIALRQFGPIKPETFDPVLDTLIEG